MTAFKFRARPGGRAPYLRLTFCYKNPVGHQDAYPDAKACACRLAQYLDGSEMSHAEASTLT